MAGAPDPNPNTTDGVSDSDAVDGVSFDLFGTLVTVSRPDDPAAAVARALEDRGVAVPDDWTAAYRERHLDRPAGAETPLPAHVAAALASRSDVDPDAVRRDAERAVRAAFDPTVRTRTGAPAAVDALAERLPVGVLSNCSVPGLADRALARSGVDVAALDAVATSVDCGWRKPDARAFRTIADDLGVDATRLLHVGDDPVADGGAVDAVATVLLTEAVPVATVPDAVAERWG